MVLLGQLKGLFTHLFTDALPPTLPIRNEHDLLRRLEQKEVGGPAYKIIMFNSTPSPH